MTGLSFPCLPPVVKSRLSMALAACVLGVALTGQGQAQGLIPVPLGPQDQLEMSESVQMVERVDPDRARGTEVTDDLEPVPELAPLRPLRARGVPAGTALRFDGERRDLDFALHVPDPARVRGLRLSTLSSINVLPERSRLRAYVNGVHVGSGPLENFIEFGTLDLELPPELLNTGSNAVRLELIQYHRIYCGPEASFALWTDLDLAASGAVLDTWDQATGQPGPDRFIMALATAAATGQAIEIRGAGGLGAQRDAWTRQITRQLGGALGGDPLHFAFTEYWGVAGAARSPARLTFLPGFENRIGFRTAGDGTQVMVIEYVPGAPAAQIPDLAGVFPHPPGPAQAPLIATDRPVTLSEAGFRTVQVRDRYSLIEQRFRLPDDYVVLTNEKAELRLDYVYAAGLPAGAMMLVHVNGTNIRLLPLRGEAGRPIEQFPVRFEARHLRAGTNTLAFEVMIPGDPADMPCPMWDGPVLAIGEGSALIAPYSPSMFLPDMHFAFANLTPEGVIANELASRAFSANDILALRGSLVQGQRDPDRATGARLHLLALDDLGAVPVGHYQFSRRAVEAVLLGRQIDPSGPSGGGGLLQISGQAQSTAALSGLFGWAERSFDAAVQWMHPRAGHLLEQWLSDQRGQAILLQLDPARPESLWMLRAPGSDITAIASAIVAARTVGEGPRGQVSVLDAQGRWHNWFAPDRQPILLEPITLTNLRHVLGNFVSAMPLRYVAGLFFLALLSAIFALRLVISTREHET